MQEWLDNNDILMNFTHNEGKSVIAERFIRTLKVKIYTKRQLIMINLKNWSREIFIIYSVLKTNPWTY